MATTHDMRYEGQNTERSVWSWLLPLALVLLGALALATYLGSQNNNNGTNTGLNSGNTSDTYLTP